MADITMTKISLYEPIGQSGSKAKKIISITFLRDDDLADQNCI